MTFLGLNFFTVMDLDLVTEPD